MRLSFSFVALATLLSTAAATPVEKRASCACGYQDSTGAVWREAVESIFTQSAGAVAAVNANWAIETWTAGGSSTALARKNYPQNVYQHNDALGLRVNAYDNSGTVRVAEIDSLRSDIQYGTFRMRAQVPSVPGVVFGFFTYNGNTSPVSEIDIEFLSKNVDYYQRVHYTNQPGAVNGVADPNAYHPTVVPGADFTTFGEHRFDWHPGATTFYYNGGLKSTINKNVPTVGSRLIANIWSNGDPNWTAGPPTSDAVATIQYIKYYFNSTSFSASALSSRCAAGGHVPLCRI